MLAMRALECLVTIAEQGSLTQAAAMLHMSQPASQDNWQETRGRRMNHAMT